MLSSMTTIDFIVASITAYGRKCKEPWTRFTRDSTIARSAHFYSIDETGLSNKGTIPNVILGPDYPSSGRRMTNALMGQPLAVFSSARSMLPYFKRIIFFVWVNAPT